MARAGAEKSAEKNSIQGLTRIVFTVRDSANYG